MRLLLSWLNELIDVKLPPQELDNTLTLAGLEVDGIENASFKFDGLIVALVEQTEQHPDADRLTIATVFDGKERHQVVCAAKNCRPNIVVAFAPIGATLQDGPNKTFTISKAKLRGVESFGMLCASDELGLTKKKCDGILELPENAPLGKKLTEYLFDPIFEISLTPNLGHAASILGITRELSAQFNTPYQVPDCTVNNAKSSSLLKSINCSIENEKKCSQFRMRMIEGVKVGESPEWLKTRLEKSGFNTINNVVDILNYVMMEMGQPMHAFDYDKLPHKQIEVKQSNEELKLETLDGEVRTIPKGTLLVHDKNTPLAIAGIMGGQSSAISDQSVNVLVEAAQFSPMEVRRSMKKMGLRSDSSYRFEKGIDPLGVERALNRAVKLISEVCGGTPSDTSIEVVSAPYTPRSINVRIAQIERLIGIHLSQNEVRTMLERLEFGVVLSEEGAVLATPPSYRNDVHTEIEVIEEIARLYGFNNIERSKCTFSTSTTLHHPLYLIEKRVREILVAENLNEFLTCNLISPELAQIGITEHLTQDNLISVLHAKSQDQSVLRHSMLPALLAAVKHNQNLQNHDISSFELGTLHIKEDANYLEKRGVALCLVGKQLMHHFASKPKVCDFYDLKGHVENLFSALGITNVTFRKSNLAPFHPGRQCEVVVGKEVLGAMGEVHPNECSKLDIDPRKRVYFAELDVEKLMQMQDKCVQFAPIPQFPSSKRDITLTVSTSTTLESIYDKITTTSCSFLRNVELIDIFTDDVKVGIDKQNVTLRITYRNDDATIEMKQVDVEHAKVLTSLAVYSKTN